MRWNDPYATTSYTVLRNPLTMKEFKMQHGPRVSYNTYRDCEVPQFQPNLQDAIDWVMSDPELIFRVLTDEENIHKIYKMWERAERNRNKQELDEVETNLTQKTTDQAYEDALVVIDQINEHGISNEEDQEDYDESIKIIETYEKGV